MVSKISVNFRVNKKYIFLSDGEIQKRLEVSKLWRRVYSNEREGLRLAWEDLRYCLRGSNTDLQSNFSVSITSLSSVSRLQFGKIQK